MGNERIYFETKDLSWEDLWTRIQTAYYINGSEWRLDKLDCDESFRRKKVDGISFKEAVLKFDEERTLSRIVIRPVDKLFINPVCPVNCKGCESGKPLEQGCETGQGQDYCIEIFLRHMGDVDYFLWLTIPMEQWQGVLNGLEVIG